MILVVDDDKAIRLSLKLILERNEYDVALAENPKAAIDIVRSHPELELVLMDMNYDNSTTGDEGLTLLKQVKVFRPEIPCILMTAWGTIDLAVQGMRAGAFDFITKPWDNGVLLDRIETAIKLRPLSRSTLGRFDTSKNSPRGEVDFISSQKPQNRKLDLPPTGGAGRGAVLPSLASVYSTIARIAPTNASVLITGESGTGKELIAEAIHRQSHRAAGPFVKVNLGGISQSLFESEMFGHKKGAFTDAKEDRVGRFELAKGGTIFLDEIGELDLASQVKLLRVLQDQTYEVLGDSHTRRTDVRVICATNADLPSMVEEHTFREDLFYRINLISIHLPPLRQRRQDIPLLVDFFLHQSSLSPAITPDAISYLQSLPFPGNIRELKNLVERTVLMAEGEELTAADFRQSLSPSSHESVCPSVSPTGPSPTLEELERAAIAASIQKHAGNLSLVAKELGISRGALYRKIEKHGL
jgi:two-component system NtrC family response regulator